MALRSAPRGWELWNACRDVERAQRSLLRSILATHEGTEFCREHGLTPSMSFDDYRAAVPIRRFSELQPRIDRMVDGERDVLVAGQAEMFVRTSGTSARPKYLPVTHAGVRTFQMLAGLWTQLALADVPGAGAGRILALTSTAQELLPSGVPAGTTTYPRQTPPGLLDGRVLTIPPSLHEPPDFERRRFNQLLYALAHDVSMLGVTAPTTLIVLFERLRAWGHELVEELSRGPVDARDAPPQDRAIWQSRLDHLRGVLAEHGALTPKLAWPKLSLMGSFIEGPSQMYVPRLDVLSEALPHRNVGYCASEGRFAVSLWPDSPGGVLMVADYVIELVEDNETCGPNTVTLAPSELEIGRRYRPIVTTACGLYRYDMEDTIEVIGWCERAPVVAFCHRSAMVALAGENMTELQIVVAMQRVAVTFGLEIVDFVAVPRWEPAQPAYYHFLVELTPREGAVAACEDVLARALEEALKDVNREYADKRRWARLGPARCTLVPPGRFLALRHDRLRAGTPDTRFKQVHLEIAVAGSGVFDAMVLSHGEGHS